MIKIVDLNDTGKTKKLLTECSKNNGVFVCRHPERVQEKCMAYGIPLVEAIGYDQWRSIVRLNNDGCCIKNSKDVYIDELERFVSFLIPHLNGYCMTVEEK